ncbi:NADH-quinone oxidoreductase subunit K [Euzebya sp.]|uniref:NADH-quinone oxidoreductase subunit K n=1 Tax=Euzebya sp. TaxID=1971409 RepID=UPI003519829D
MIIEAAILAGVLAALGVAQLLQRTLTRIVIGVALLGQAANLVLLVAGGPAGNPPLVGAEDPISDPLPQAFALTAIVITFAMLAFLLALAWRDAKLTGEDRVEDDIEDRRVARMRDEEEQRQHQEVGET